MFTDQLREIQNEIKNYGAMPVIVEGIKDKSVLHVLGFDNVLDISGKPLEKVVDKIKEQAIILTDFDKEGNDAAHRLAKLLSSRGIKVYSSLRKKIKNLFRVCKIEELNSLTKLLEDDYYGKTCSIYDKIFNRSRVLNRRGCRKA
ncbi:MAG: toprim domain-containing protein [Candidatus Aenigmarchaeota archaeon]|nr:toprim domain-containing protein [Candidatus Aenigmarchaeota archaeon]